MKNRGELVLYLWDYFFCANVPAPGDEVPWAAIERATCRLRESELYLDADTPADLRLLNAKRFRNDVRRTLRDIARLTVKPEPWVIARLTELNKFADDLLGSIDGRVALN